MTRHQFEKGHIPWNKDKKGCMKANKGSFTRETLPHKRELGEPKDEGIKRGLVCTTEERVAKKDTRSGKVYMHHRRTSYARYLMGDVPKGCVVYHKDGNYQNNNLDNLEIISRAELIRRNRK